MTPTGNHAWRQLVPLAILLVLGILLLFISGSAELVILAALLSYILDPVTTSIEARGISRGFATLIVLGTIIGVITGLMWWLIPVVKAQIMTLQSGATSEQAKASIDQIEAMLREQLGPFGIETGNLSERIAEAKKQLGESALEFLVSDFLSLIVHGVTLPFMMFFLIKDGRDMKKKIVSLVPNRYFEFVMDLLYKMDLQLGNYFRSQFADAIAFGVLATLALWILGVPYFFFIGVFAGMANIVPYVGPLAGVLPAFVVAVLNTGDIMAGFRVVVAFILLKFIDDVAVQPFLVSRGVELHPLIVLIAIMMGGGLFGILGMLLAVPVVGFLKVVLRESIATYRKYRFN